MCKIIPSIIEKDRKCGNKNHLTREPEWNVKQGKKKPLHTHSWGWIG